MTNIMRTFWVAGVGLAIFFLWGCASDGEGPGVSNDNGNIIVTWTHSCSNCDLAGFSIYRSETNSQIATATNKIGTALPSATTFQFPEKDLRADTDYYFIVEAYDSANNLAPSAVMSFNLAADS